MPSSGGLAGTKNQINKWKNIKLEEFQWFSMDGSKREVTPSSVSEL